MIYIFLPYFKPKFKTIVNLDIMKKLPTAKIDHTVPHVWSRYALRVSQICPTCVTDMPQMCSRYFCPGYDRGMPQMCSRSFFPRYAPDVLEVFLPEVWPWYAPDVAEVFLPEVCPWNAPDVLRGFPQMYPRCIPGVHRQITELP